MFTGAPRLAELALDALRLPHVVAGGEEDHGVDEDAEDQPGQRHRADLERPGGGHQEEEQREAPEHDRPEREHPQRQPQLRRHQRGHVDLAEPGLLVDLAGQRPQVARWSRRRGAAGDPHARGAAGPVLGVGRPARRHGAVGSAGAQEPVAQLAGVPPAHLELGAVQNARCSGRAPCGPPRTWGRATSVLRWMRTNPAAAPALLEGAERDADQVGAAARCAGGRSRPAPARSGSGCAGVNRVTPPSSTGMVSSSGGLPAAAAWVRLRRAVDDPADRLGQPFGPHRLHDVVGGVQLEGVDRVLRRRR